MHKLLKLRNQKARVQLHVTSATSRSHTDIPYENLSAITAERCLPNPAELLSAERSPALEQLEANFDYILLDTSQVTSFRTRCKWRRLDGVVDGGKIYGYPYPSMNEAVAALRFANANIVERS